MTHENDPTKNLRAYVSFDPALDREAMGADFYKHFGLVTVADGTVTSGHGNRDGPRPPSPASSRIRHYPSLTSTTRSESRLQEGARDWSVAQPQGGPGTVTPAVLTADPGGGGPGDSNRHIQAAGAGRAVPLCTRAQIGATCTRSCDCLSRLV